MSEPRRSAQELAHQCLGIPIDARVNEKYAVYIERITEAIESDRKQRDAEHEAELKKLRKTAEEAGESIGVAAAGPGPEFTDALICGIGDKAFELQEERYQLRAELDRLREALQLYAERKHWVCARCGRRDNLNCFISKYVGPIPGWKDDGEDYCNSDLHAYSGAEAALTYEAPAPEPEYTPGETSPRRAAPAEQTK